MGVPKRKTSKSRRRMRQRSQKKAIVTARACPKCGAPQLSHRVCPACGMYKGRQVLIISADE